jgi:hypothetical protein
MQLACSGLASYTSAKLLSLAALAAWYYARS